MNRVAVILYVSLLAVLALATTAQLGLHVHGQAVKQQQARQQAAAEFMNEARIQCARAFPLGKQRQQECMARMLELAAVSE